MRYAYHFGQRKWQRTLEERLRGLPTTGTTLRADDAGLVVDVDAFPLVRPDHHHRQFELVQPEPADLLPRRPPRPASRQTDLLTRHVDDHERSMRCRPNLPPSRTAARTVSYKK